MLLLIIPLRAIIWKLGETTAETTGGERPTITAIATWLSEIATWLSENVSPYLGAIVTWMADYFSGHLGLLGVPSIVGHALVLGLMMVVSATFINLTNGTLIIEERGQRVFQWKYLWKYLFSAFVSGATAGVLIPLLEVLIKSLNDAGRPELAATIIPPLGFLIAVAALVVEVAMLGRTITEAEREWWARLSALLLIAALVWLAALGTIVYVPAAFLAAEIPLRVVLTSGWLGAAVFGVLLGRYAAPRPASGGSGGGNTLALIAAFMPPIFLVGLLGFVSLLVSFLVNMPPLAFPAWGEEWAGVALYLRGFKDTSFWTLVVWLIFTGLLFWISRKIDVNLFSLNAMYANRLIRCYLGASRPKALWADRWGDIHNPTAGGGAPSLSPTSVTSIVGHTSTLAQKIEKQREKLDDLDRRESQLDPADQEIDQKLCKDLYERKGQLNPDDRKQRQQIEMEMQRLLTRMTVDRLQKEFDELDRQLAQLDPAEQETRTRLAQERRRLVVPLRSEELAKLDWQLADLDPSKRKEKRGIDLQRRKLMNEVTHAAVGLPPRDANPVTGFDPSDDIPLYELQIGKRSVGGRVYWGSYLLINTTLNLVAGGELAWRDRKGEAFVLTPLYCGSKGVGYAKVTKETLETLTLGRAITISGAAVDPNMSFYQSSALTAFLTIFNARLGYWMQNPLFKGWKAESPSFDHRLIVELFGQTDNKGKFVHLSDGGHFENLGVYELIRRRCRYIVVAGRGRGRRGLQR